MDSVGLFLGYSHWFAALFLSLSLSLLLGAIIIIIRPWGWWHRHESARDVLRLVMLINAHNAVEQLDSCTKTIAPLYIRKGSHKEMRAQITKRQSKRIVCEREHLWSSIPVFRPLPISLSLSLNLSIGHLKLYCQLANESFFPTASFHLMGKGGRQSTQSILQGDKWHFQFFNQREIEIEEGENGEETFWMSSINTYTCRDWCW